MIPSLLQIPSAVSDSKLHSVLPNNGKGDFTFDRSTGATRINKDGLIEEVGYFSSELVQNGNFSELGSELITNGDFATDSNWGKGIGWSIINGVASCDGTQTGGTQLTQTSLTFTNGKTYKVVFTCTIEAGNLDARLQGSGATVTGDTVTTSGTYTQYLVSTGNTSFRMRGNADFIGTVDNVSVKEVDPNDRWDAEFYGTDVTITDTLNLVDNGNSGGAGVFQAATIENGKTYKIKFDITASTGSSIVALMFCDNRSGSNQGVVSSYYSAVGSYDLRLTANKDNLGFRFRFARSTGRTASIDNVSIVEVQGDRPRLSYDITNGVVEDKPHLLLEPSSTNLLTQSNGFDNWTSSNLTLTSGQSSAITALDEAWLFTATGAAANVTVSVSSSGANTLSVFAKAGTQDAIFIRFSGSSNPRAFFNLSNGTIISSSGITSSNVEAFKDGWYRISITGTDTVTDARIYVADSTENFPSSGNIYVQNAQLEQQSYATSYIKTAGTTITRAAETCNNSKPSVNSTEGVLYAEIAALANDLEYEILSVSDGSTDNRAYLQYTNVSNQIKFVYKIGGVTQAGIGTATFDIVDFHKIACKWKANDFALWIDGNEIGTDTNGNVNAAGTFTEVNFDSGNTIFYGKVKGLAVYNEALTDAQLIELTS